MKIDRAEVEKLLDYATSTKDSGTNIIKPRSLEALCRLALEVMDAPVGWQSPDGLRVMTDDAVRFDGKDTTGWKRVRLVRVSVT